MAHDVLDNGICVDCRSTEHYLVDGTCEHCSDLQPMGEHEQALLAALNELDMHAEASRAWDPAKHPRNPKGSPGGGRFRSMVDRLKDAIEAHRKGEGDGHPFDGFSREQLRRVARARGIDLKRGEDRDSIAEKLLGHLNQPVIQAGKGRRVRRVEGRDRIGDISPATVPSESSWPIDKQLTAIAKMQGFDGKPSLADSAGLDKAIGDGWIETWRGVKDNPGYAPAKPRKASQIIDDLKEGPWELGSGIYGNGVYTSVRRFTSESYRGATPRDYNSFDPGDMKGGAPGGLARMAVDPQARMIDFADLVDEMTNDTRWHPANADQFTVSVLSDYGRYAAARGYDVIRISGDRYNDGAPYPAGEINADQYVILNRTALMIQREDPE